MRPISILKLAGPLAFLAITAVAGGAQAQQSADQIIQSLKPTGNLTTGATRGIKLGGQAAPSDTAVHPAAAAAPKPAVGHAAKPETVSTSPAASSGLVNLTVNFPSGSADLTPAARQSLDALGKALSSADLANYRFRIEGHTDNVGTADSNRALSQQRAEAVVNYLSSQYHVQTSRLEAVGMGEDQPLVQTPPQTPEPRNRRVQVINLGS
jgi:OmpA-OmpF porin, OOP family